ncbi:MAG: cryptochrome/photolyase family protein [Halochromatium sp.]
MSSTALVWLRRDLRLGDNPALAAALARCERVIPVYLHAPDEEAPWQPGAASRWWLHQSLGALGEHLQRLGSRLIIRQGASLATLRALIADSGASQVHWNRGYEPASIARDSAIEQALRAEGIDCASHNAALLCEPWALKTGSGDPYRVFTPYWRRLGPRLTEIAARSAPATAAPPETLPPVPDEIGGLAIKALALRPTIPWDQGLLEAWQPGEAGAHAQLERFLHGPIGSYREARDWPAESGTSRLSPHLHFGEIGPRQILARMREAHADASGAGSGAGARFGTSPGAGARSNSASSLADSAIAEPYLRELGWREFSHQLLYHFPQTPSEPLNPRFADFPWRGGDTEPLLKAWQQGRTGIPIVDAGMRELWHTGWMHNRARMIVASLLTKNLRLPWQEGARWFWDTLVDADLANNTQGWQWSAGCGADAAPYFRILNPVRQGERFDAQGRYVRRWCPELAKLPDQLIHRPWQAPESLLAACGVRLAREYPAPIVDLKTSRAEALAAYERVKRT